MNRTNTGANTDTEQILVDIFVMAIAFGIDLLLFKNMIGPGELPGLIIVVITFITINILANKGEYLYNVTLFNYLDRIHEKNLKSFILSSVITLLLLYLPIKTNRQSFRFYVIFLIIAYVLGCMKMLIYRPFYDRIAKRDKPRTLFVGEKASFEKFRDFLDKTNIRLEPVGYVALNKEELDNSYIGCLENLEDLIRSYQIDQIYIIQQHEDELAFTQKYEDLCIKMGVTVRLVVDLYNWRRADHYVSTVGTYPVITFHTITLNTYEQIIKRTMDILAGIVGVILSSPIMLVTAIAIKLDSPGPILFKQTRVGQNGRHFKIYKFRSMYIDAEERKKELLEQNELEGGVMFKIKDDPRITRVGKFIRKTSIDELPQFFNILGGSMSLVGTRPPTLDEVEKYETSQWRRISIKPGLTGMWQVSGRSNIKSFDEIVELDTEYIDNWTLGMDIKIIFKTILVLLKHDDAY